MVSVIQSFAIPLANSVVGECVIADALIHAGNAHWPVLASRDLIALLKMTGDAAPLMATFAALDDIALLELEQPIDDVKPIPLYKGEGEEGALVCIYGKGATGNGLVGQYPGSPHRGQLRRAYNYITSADWKWLGYRFDEGAQGHPLEGMLGDGDSGGPVLMKVNGADELVGLSDRKAWTGDLAGFRPGIYGMYSYQVRISHFARWIESVIAANS